MENTFVKKYSKLARRRFIIITVITILILAITLTFILLKRGDIIKDRVPVSGITMNHGQYNQETVYIEGFSPLTLNYTIAPSNATNKKVTYSVVKDGVDSSDLVITDGVITSISKSGVYLVTVTTVDGGYSASLTIEAIMKTVEVVEATDILVNEVTSKTGTIEQSTINNVITYLFADIQTIGEFDFGLKNYQDKVVNVEYTYDITYDKTLLDITYDARSGKAEIKGRKPGLSSIVITAKAAEYDSISITIQIEIKDSIFEKKVVKVEARNNKEIYYENQEIKIVYYLIFDDGTEEQIVLTDEIKITTVVNDDHTVYTITVNYPNVEIITLSYKVYKIKVQSIEIVEEKVKLATNCQKQRVKVTYNDQSTEEIPLSELAIVDNSTAGIKNILVTYKDYNTTISYEVVDKVAKEIFLPVSRTFLVGEEVNLSLRVTFTDDIYSDEIVEKKFTISNCQNDPSDNICSLNYVDTLFGLEYTYSYSVKCRSLTNMIVIGINQRYKIAEQIDINNILIKLEFTNSEYNVDLAYNDIDWKGMQFDTATPGMHSYDGVWTKYSDQITVEYEVVEKNISTVELIKVEGLKKYYKQDEIVPVSTISLTVKKTYTDLIYNENEEIVLSNSNTNLVNIPTTIIGDEMLLEDEITILIEGKTILLPYKVYRQKIDKYSVTGLDSDYLINQNININDIEVNISFFNPDDEIVYPRLVIKLKASDISVDQLPTTPGHHSFKLNDYSEVELAYDVHDKTIANIQAIGYSPFYNQAAIIDYAKIRFVVSFTYSGYSDEIYAITDNSFYINNELITLDNIEQYINTNTVGCNTVEYKFLDVSGEITYYVSYNNEFDLFISADKSRYLLNDKINITANVKLRNSNVFNYELAVNQTVLSNDENCKLFVKENNQLVETSLNDLMSSLGSKTICIQYFNLMSNEITIQILEKVAFAVTLVEVEADETPKSYVDNNQFKQNDNVKLKFKVDYEHDVASEEVVRLLDTSKMNDNDTQFTFSGFKYDYSYFVIGKTIDKDKTQIIGFNDSYRINDVVDVSKLSLVIVYLHPSIYPNEIISSSNLSNIDFSTTTVGNVKGTLVYDDITYEATYLVIGIKAITCLNLSSSYLVGDSFDYSSLRFIAEYSEKYESVSLDYNYIVDLVALKANLPNNMISEQCSFQVKYQNLTADFEIKVVPKVIDLNNIDFTFDIPTKLFENEDILPYLIDKAVTLHYTDSRYQSDTVYITEDSIEFTANDNYSLKVRLYDILVINVTGQIVKRNIVNVTTSSISPILQYQNWPIKYYGWYQIGKYETQENYITEISSEVDVLNAINCTEAGTFTHIIKVDDLTYNFEYQVIGVDSIRLASSLGSFYRSEEVQLESFALKIIYANNAEIELPLDSKLITCSIDTLTTGTKNAVITYYNHTVSAGYTVYELFRSDDSTVYSLTNRNTFNIYVDSRYKTTPVINFVTGNYQIISSVFDAANNMFIVEVELYASSDVSFYLQENYNTLQSVHFEIIDLLAIDYNIDGKTYIDIQSTPFYTVTFTPDPSQFIKIDYTVEIITGKDLATITPNYSNNTFIITPKGIGVIEVGLNVLINNQMKVIKKTINIVNSYISISFVDSNTTYGFVGDMFTIGMYNWINNRTEAATMAFTVISGGQDISNSPRLNYYTSDDSIAYFSGNVLNIVGPGEVVLIVEDLTALKAGSNPIISTRTIRVVDGVNVATYEALKAVNKTYPTVLMNNIEVGEKMINLETSSNGTVTRKAAVGNTFLNSYMSRSVTAMESTWDTDFIRNDKGNDIKPADTQIYYCFSIENSIYGNGYELNAYNVTTLSSINSTISKFNGPLNFVDIAGTKIKGQDNIAFLVNDNVTINNVQLYGCDDGYLNEGNGFNYSKLDKVGTTVEVVGDNVKILNSRIRNGRNCLRVYGATDHDKVLNVEVTSCIIQNAREFLVKIGTNKEIASNTSLIHNNVKVNVRDLYNQGMSPVQVMDILNQNNNRAHAFNSSSPMLYDEAGNAYQSHTEANLNNQYFIDNYVKTKVTIKDSTLENSQLFAIGMESKFAGPILGGFKYPLSYNGIDFTNIFTTDIWGKCYNLSGTSYSAILKLEGDVKVYNWMKLSEVDSTSMVEPSVNALVSSLVKFELSQMISNVKRNDPSFNNITLNVNGEEYVNGNIIFYGGGRNYHMVDMSSLSDKNSFTTFTIPMSALTDDTKSKMEQIASKAMPWIAGQEPFRMFVYTDYNYNNAQIATSQDKYGWIKVAK